MTSMKRAGGFREIARITAAVSLAAGLWACGDDNGHHGAAGQAVQRSNLVADISGAASATDANLVNAWGLARTASGPFWVADNHAGVSTLYNGSGQAFPVGAPLIVTIPPPAGSPVGTSASPTGLVVNGTTDFVVSAGATSGPALFIFSTEDGTISGWNQTVNPTAAILMVDNSSDEAIYKGLALAVNGSSNFLYATDFHNGRVDVFDSAFQPVQPSGSFTDPNLPAGFAPFGVAAINGKLYVTYAKQDEDAEDDVRGPGNGYVDVYETNGTFNRRLVSQGVLNSPWAMVLAPAGFGDLGGELLIGNFGDGRINAFDASTGASRGSLNDGNNPIAIDGLWALEFGNDANAGDANTLFFTAGPADEEHGLFGSLSPM